MTADLREAIARAIYEQHWSKRQSRDSRCPWERHSEIGKRPWLEEADAALSAIRESGCVVVPREATDRMITVAWETMFMTPIASEHVIMGAGLDAAIAASPYEAKP